MAVRERRKRIYRKRIPYGMQNFEDVILEDCYYVDKTPFIEDVEDSNKYFFYIRPRRFGKSLTLSMLENYYDINKKDKFESLFGGLYIGENPTPEHNTYLVIHLNFAEVGAGLDNYQKGMDGHCNIMFGSFCRRYAHLLPQGTEELTNQRDGAIEQLAYLCEVCKECYQKIYLFIDEYDNFTNNILANEEQLERYRNQTHGEGYLRRFFNTIKGAAGTALGRVFVTGVSPVTMDDLTSGFNIRTDYNKLRMLIRHDKEFAHDASIIQQLVTTGFVTGRLVENFPADKINNPDNFLSLLFYFGMVTIDGTYKGATKFVIPNEVVRDQIFTYLLDTYKENDLTYDSYGKTQLESRLAYDGDYKAYFEFIADSLKRYSSQRDKQKGEAYVHGFTLAMASQCRFYRPISELDNEGGYADIFLSPLCDIFKDMVDSYIIELKYCKAHTTDEQLQQLFREASAQISRYAESDIVKESVRTTRLHKLVVIYRGIEMAVCEEIG